MAVFEVPVSNEPQTFEINLAGTDYLLTCRFNNSDEAGWFLDIANAETAEPIVAGIPIITGADLLAGLAYLGIGGQLFCYTDGAATAVPTYENLGIESHVFFQTEAADV